MVNVNYSNPNIPITLAQPQSANESRCEWINLHTATSKRLSVGPFDGRTTLDGLKISKDHFGPGFQSGAIWLVFSLQNYSSCEF